MTSLKLNIKGEYNSVMNKIKIGLVGYGYIGKIHSIGYLNIPLIFPELKDRIEMTKVIRRKNSLKEESYWLERGEDLEELVNGGIHFADICTPNFLHLPQISFLANKGVNIYCEKPLGINFQESTAISEVAEEKKIINQVALVYRFMPALAKARAYINNGGIGKIISFRTHLLHSSYLNPSRSITWRLEKEKSGGGVLIDLGIHLTDTIRFLLGEAVALTADTKTLFNKRTDSNGSKSTVDVDEWGLINLEMVSGAKGTIEVSKVSLNPLESFNIEIYGTNGFIKISDHTFNDPIVYSFSKKDNSIKSIFLKDSGTDQYVKYLETIVPSGKMSLGSMVNLHLASIMNMLKNIESSRIIFEETPTFRESAKSQKIIDCAYQSSKAGGRRVTI